MEIHVYETYVKAADGHTMHFDILTDKKGIDKAVSFGKEWLKSIGEDAELECNLCHSQNASETIEQSIKKNKYVIQKMEGCP